jgi:hypothetical protein
MFLVVFAAIVVYSEVERSLHRASSERRGAGVGSRLPRRLGPELRRSDRHRLEARQFHGSRGLAFSLFLTNAAGFRILSFRDGD